jgi:hypothetical protein
MLLDKEERTAFRPHPDETHQTMTLGTEVISPYFPPGATKIMMQAITKALRYTLDGTTPSATVGFQLAAAATPIVIEINEHTKLQVIREESGTILQYEIGE